MKKSYELLISAVTTGVSAVLLLCACLFVVGAVTLSSLPSWGAWVFGISVGAGFVAMACARNYGVLIGVVVPGLLLGILGLHWSQCDCDVKRCIALALASAGFWPVLRIGSQMIATDLRTRFGIGPGGSGFTAAAILLLLSKAASMLTVRSGPARTAFGP